MLSIENKIGEWIEFVLKNNLSPDLIRVANVHHKTTEESTNDDHCTTATFCLTVFVQHNKSMYRHSPRFMHACVLNIT